MLSFEKAEGSGLVRCGRVPKVLSVGVLMGSHLVCSGSGRVAEPVGGRRGSQGAAGRHRG